MLLSNGKIAVYISGLLLECNDLLEYSALEEWRKRKMERARKRELGKDGATI